MRFCSSCQIVHSFVALLSLLIDIIMFSCCVWDGVTGVKTDGMQLLTAGGDWERKTKDLLAGGF